MTDKFIDVVNKNPNLINEIYKDTFQGSTRQLGRIGENILKFVSLPFTFLGLTAEQIEEKYKIFISRAVDKVPNEKRCIPKSAVVGPLLEYVKYLFDDEDSENLIEIFSNLLANAIHSDVKNDVHVSYVHTLLQLGCLEAVILRQLYELDDNYDILGVVFKRDMDSDKKYIEVLSDEPDPLVTENENVFFYYYLHILDDKINISDNTLKASLDILVHHNLIKKFMIYKLIDIDKYSLMKPEIINVNDYDLYESVFGYTFTKYGENFMSACTDPMTNKRSTFACEKCGSRFINIKGNGICLECGCDDVKLIL